MSKKRVLNKPEEVLKITSPGIESLHTKSVQEISMALAVAIKARPNITKLEYIVGEYIQITYQPV